MNLPENAEVLDTAVGPFVDGRWYAAIRFRVPGQGSYDRAPHDDMLRTDFPSQEAAQRGLDDKLARKP